jgi:hypothetical protein
MLKALRRIVKPFASLKLAVVVILCLGAITAWGTFVEAQYDSAVARKVVYHSVYMFGVMGLLAINLIAVMIDRWPWKKHHLGFVFAHIGILVLMIGSVMTQVYGVDGSMNIGIGESSDSVTIDQKDFTVYTSMTGDRYATLFDYSQAHNGNEADFSQKEIHKNPLTVSLPEGQIEVVDYLPFALRDEKILPSNRSGDGPAVRFQLQNAMVNMVDWIQQPSRLRHAFKDLGPAQVVLATDDTQTDYTPKDSNAIVLKPLKKILKSGRATASELGPQVLSYAIYTKSLPGKIRRGTVKVGETIQTGWMGLALKIIQYLPAAKESITFKEMKRPTELTTSALKISYTNSLSGEKAQYWLGLNSLVKLFSENAVYIVTYANRRVHLDFPMTLKQFKVDHYEGTQRASAYQSQVLVGGLGERTISMNEPLKHGGFTFYQSSFNNDDKGRPVASIFSVNRDPGRWIKYLGCLIIVMGIINMFYFKRRAKKS